MGCNIPRNIIVFLLLSVIYNLTRCEDDYCESCQNIVTRLKVENHRNESGHWVSQVELLQDVENNHSGGSWTVDVTQSTSKCASNYTEKENTTGYVALDATVFRVEERLSGGAWHSVAGGAVRVSSTPLAWEAAVRGCRAEGGELLGLAVPRKVVAVVAALARLRLDAAFVRSPSGETLNPWLLANFFAHWAPHRPASEGDSVQDACSAIFSNGTLADVDCSNQLAFACDYEDTQKK